MNMLKPTTKLFPHQETTATFKASHPRCFNTSDPGTGKTLASLVAYLRSKEGRLLVLAPLSILQPSWGDDIEKYTNLSYQIAHGSEKKRKAALNSQSDVIITNHDAVKWLEKDPSLLASFSHIVVDEFTAFKNRTAQRSKALKKLTDKVKYLWMLSGTPNSNTVLDLWYPALLVDNGVRLGKRFWQFRSQVCTPVQVGPQINHVKWEDKPDATFDVFDRMKDITIRFTADECIDLPEHSVHDMLLEMPKNIAQQYKNFIEQDFVETETGVVTSIHAGARVRKALQLLSGALYDGDGVVHKVHEDRYRLVMDLIDAREQCVVAFNYRHEREALCRLAEKYGFSYGVIDGSIPNAMRTEYVSRFQTGELRVIFAHPQSASHGLTLTRGTTTIWCSPTYMAEHYQQFIRRIYRAGQTRKTETIRIAYRGSKEIDVYKKLSDKVVRMEDLLSLFHQNSRAA